jgi:hypothetical protein
MPTCPPGLASSIPAAYTSVLQQLGCSREVGLILAAGLKLGTSSGWGEMSVKVDPIGKEVLEGLYSYGILCQALQHCSIHQPQTAALHLSMSAMSLQWLSAMSPVRLAALKHECRAVQHVCQVAELGHARGRELLQKRCLQPQQQRTAGEWTLLRTTNKAVGQLGAAVLEKMLIASRSLPGPGESSTTGGSTSSNKDGGSSDTSILLQACQYLLQVLAATVPTAAHAELSSASATAGQHNSTGSLLQLPVPYAQCCKLLQDCVRMAAAAPASVRSVSIQGPLSATVLTVIGSMFGAVRCQFGMALLTPNGSPLLEPTAAAGDVGSLDALQLFGLLCSWLKAFSGTGSSTTDPETGMLAFESPSNCLFVARVSSLLEIALHSSSSSGHPGNSSSSSSSSSSNAPSNSSSLRISTSCSTAASRTFTAALPWLVLLGRCCYACGVDAQRWQVSLGCHPSDGPAASLQHLQWLTHGPILAQNLQQLQSSLAAVAQWLAAAGTVQQLTTLGYQPVYLQQQLTAAAHALPVATLSNSSLFPGVSSDSCSAAATLLKAAQEQLLVAGRVLSGFAIPHACNHMACSNFCCPSEAQLVGGRSCICAGCCTARYCGKICQRAAWRQHKPICKALAAAAATAATAAVGETPASATEGSSTATD